MYAFIFKDEYEGRKGYYVHFCDDSEELEKFSKGKKKIEILENIADYSDMERVLVAASRGDISERELKKKLKDIKKEK